MPKSPRMTLDDVLDDMRINGMSMGKDLLIACLREGVFPFAHVIVNGNGRANYKERFKAEVYQLDIRIGKLASMLSAWEAGELKFKPSCSYDLLEAQLNSMKVYRHFLCERAKIEGIHLYEE